MIFEKIDIMFLVQHAVFHYTFFITLYIRGGQNATCKNIPNQLKAVRLYYEYWALSVFNLAHVV
jgi:hypothetical protein